MSEVISITPKRKRRVFLWFFLAVQVLFLIWIIAGAHAASSQPVDCSHVTAQQCQTLNDAQDVGTGLGAIAVVLIWFFVDAFLAIGYGIYRLAKRP